MSGTAPVTDYESLMDLAGRIHQHLATHPKDPQALDDLHYVVSQLKGGATQAANTQEMTAAVGPQTADPQAAITSGLTQAATDIPRSLLQTITHPVQAVGQLTGLGNIRKAWDVFHDPEAQAAEKWDALLRASPANLGYATERGLLEATGAKADTPTSLQEQAHRAGNVASLGLLGISRNTPGMRLAGRVVGKLPLVGPLTRAAGDVLQRYGKPVKPPMDPVIAAGLRERIAQPLGGPLEDIAAAQADRAAGKITEQEFNTAMEVASHRVNAPPQGLLAPQFETPAFTRGPEPMTVEAMQGRAGIPTSAAKAEAQAIQAQMAATKETMARIQRGATKGQLAYRAQQFGRTPPGALQSVPYAQLAEALQNPAAPAALRQAVLVELQRRGIIGPGLLGAP